MEMTAANARVSLSDREPERERYIESLALLDFALLENVELGHALSAAIAQLGEALDADFILMDIPDSSELRIALSVAPCWHRTNHPVDLSGTTRAWLQQIQPQLQRGEFVAREACSPKDAAASTAAVGPGSSAFSAGAGGAENGGQLLALPLVYSASLAAVLLISSAHELTRRSAALHDLLRSASASISMALGRAIVAAQSARSAQLLQDALAHSQVELFEQDRELRYTWIHNHAWIEPSQIIGRQDQQLFNAADAAKLTAVKGGVLASGEPARVEISVSAPDGTPEHFDLFVRPLRDPAGQVCGVRTVAVNISHLRRAERAAQRFEGRYRELLKRMPAIVYVTGPQGTEFVSEHVTSVLGIIPEVLPPEHPLLHMLHTADRERVSASVRQSWTHAEPLREEYRVVRGDGRVVWLRDESFAIEIAAGCAAQRLGIAIDITAEKEAESVLRLDRDQLERLVAERTRELSESHRQVMLAERLSSLGTLAAGIAHEINNPLGAIEFAATLARQELSDPLAVGQYLADIRESVARCARIVRGVMQFGRDGGVLRGRVNLNETIRYVARLCRAYLVGRNAELTFELAADLPDVLANETDMEQLLTNLVRNAAEALQTSGTVVLRSCALQDQVRLQVQDSGVGMTAEQIGRAFDPFFTTRIADGGTGLGLSVCYGIVQRHGGQISIESVPNMGTTVTVQLPVAGCGTIAGGAHHGPGVGC